MDLKVLIKGLYFIFDIGENVYSLMMMFKGDSVDCNFEPCMIRLCSFMWYMASPYVFVFEEPLGSDSRHSGDDYVVGSSGLYY